LEASRGIGQRNGGKIMMKVENGKIVEITESELFTLYLKRGMDDIYSFPQYVEMFKKAGCVILDQEA
jgi:hypothetical protein